MTDESDVIRRMPVRRGVILYDGDYDGWRLEVRTNAPLGVIESFGSGNVDGVLDALVAISISSNFVDDDGKPIDVTTKNGWRKAGMDLATETMKRYRSVIALPKATATPSSPLSHTTRKRSRASTR